MNLLTILVQPILNAALQFVIAVAQDIAPEIAEDLKDFFAGVEGIASDAVTGDMSLQESVDSLKIQATLLKQKGETILIQLQASAEKFPAKIYGALTGAVGSLVGPLEKLAGL